MLLLVAVLVQGASPSGSDDMEGEEEYFVFSDAPGASYGTGSPRFTTARLERDNDLAMSRSLDPELRYDINRVRAYWNTPSGYTYSRAECPECDPSWTVPAISTASQRGLSALENMATAEIDNEQLFNYQQGQRNLAQLAIRNPTTYPAPPPMG